MHGSRQKSPLIAIAGVLGACVVAGFLSSGSCYWSVSSGSGYCNHYDHRHDYGGCDHVHNTAAVDADHVAEAPEELFRLQVFETVVEEREGRADLRGFRGIRGLSVGEVLGDPEDPEEALRAFCDRVLQVNAELLGIDERAERAFEGRVETDTGSWSVHRIQSRPDGVRAEARVTGVFQLFVDRAGRLRAIERL